MINIIFKIKSIDPSNDNCFLPINIDYKLSYNSYHFGSLSKTNIFIGENNSGKSRFLRHLFSLQLQAISKERFKKFSDSIQWDLPEDPYRQYCSHLEAFDDFYKKIGSAEADFANEDNTFFDNLKEHCVIILNENKYYFPILRGFKDYKSIINSKLKNFLASTNLIQNKDAIHHYISLLNLETNGLEDFDIYREIIVQEYFKGQDIPKNNILTGGKLYKEIKSMLLGSAEQRKLIGEFQLFLRENFFSECESVQLIPNEEKKILYVKIGNDERPIYDWGDGTQQLIVIFFSLFVHKDEKNKLFFIEEPEMYLHPGMLRKFIEVINSDTFKNHQYFITTHSNAILDTSADSNIEMSIFKFKKVQEASAESKAHFYVEQCNNGDVSLLNELGVRNSSIFLSNCSIWVEGITDRLYLKHFLDLYAKKHPGKTKFRENIDFTFIEYGGGNLAHLNFENEDSCDSINAKYINNKIFLIADNDNSSQTSAKGQRKKRLREVLKENFYELTALEIENLITQETLKAVLIEQNSKEAEIINQKLAKDKKFAKRKLGKFIDDLFDGKLRKYSSESGSIKNKLDFCNAVIQKTSDYDKLSSEAKALTQKIYNFIESNNKA